MSKLANDILSRACRSYAESVHSLANVVRVLVDLEQKRDLLRAQIAEQSDLVDLARGELGHSRTRVLTSGGVVVCEGGRVWLEQAKP